MDRSSTSNITQTPLGVFDMGFVHGLLKEVRGQLPVEKAREKVKMVQAWKYMQAMGSTSINGVGQKIASIPPRLFFRWQRQYPGCWNDRDFVMRMLKDNPELCAPGFTPKAAPKII